MNPQRLFRPRLCAALLSSLLFSSLLPCTFAASAKADPPRALWVWFTKNIREQPEAQADFFHFLAAPKGDASHAITTLYFDGMETADFKDPKTVTLLRKFLTTAHERHLKVQFLCGQSNWALPAGQPEALSYLNTVLAFNRASPAEARYDGFQYDVEPYTLPGWPSAALENGMLSLLDKSNAAIHASGRPLTLGLAIPRWFGQAQFDYLDRKIIDRADEIVVMDYVTTPEQLVNDPSDVLTYASKKHKAVWIGVETGPVADAPKSTFDALGNAAMEAQLKVAAPKFQSQPSFKGYAIHHYASYILLKP